MIVVSTLVAAGGIGGTPDPNGLPGSAALQSLISGIAFWALLALARRASYFRSGLGPVVPLR